MNTRAGSIIAVEVYGATDDDGPISCEDSLGNVYQVVRETEGAPEKSDELRFVTPGSVSDLTYTKS